MTAGETWHSAGLILQMKANDIEVQLRSKTRTFLEEIQQETGMDPGWKNNGGLYLARSKVNNYISEKNDDKNKKAWFL